MIHLSIQELTGDGIAAKNRRPHCVLISLHEPSRSRDLGKGRAHIEIGLWGKKRFSGTIRCPKEQAVQSYPLHSHHTSLSGANLSDQAENVPSR